MFVELRVKLKNNKDYGFEISSLLHGVMMESIDADYADKLHREGLKPYSQHVEREDGSLVWKIATFTQEAKENIVDRLAQKESIFLSYKNDKLDVEDRECRTLEYRELLAQTYFSCCPRRVRLDFITPTAFKVSGRYQFYPTVEHIFKSLVSKHDSIDPKSRVASESLFEQIEKYVHIVGYRLRSTRFAMEGTNISSFMGSVTLSIGGTQQFVNLINMLCAMGEYTGVGIKTGIGMGAVKMLQMHKTGNAKSTVSEKNAGAQETVKEREEK